MLVGFIVVAVEGIGDITATEEASQLATTGTAHARRIQGGILADGGCPHPNLRVRRMHPHRIAVSRLQRVFFTGSQDRRYRFVSSRPSFLACRLQQFLGRHRTDAAVHHLRAGEPCLFAIVKRVASAPQCGSTCLCALLSVHEQRMLCVHMNSGCFASGARNAFEVGLVLLVPLLTAYCMICRTMVSLPSRGARRDGLAFHAAFGFSSLVRFLCTMVSLVLCGMQCTQS